MKNSKCYSLLSDQDKDLILNKFNDTYIDYPKDKTIVDLFDETVRKYADRVALIYKEKSITYKELNEQANLIANYLLKKDSEKVVGILSDNDHYNMATAILGVLKSGKAYIPISPEFPLERKIKILESSSSRTLLSNKDYISLELKQQYTGNIFCLDDLDDGISENPEVKISPEQSAYVIYTSGSTGEPKGVEVQHKALTNFCYWYIDEYELQSESQILKYAGVAFDVSISEIFPTLISGAKLHFSDKFLRLSPDEIANYVNKNNISHIFMPPAIYEQFASKNAPCLKYLITAGDKLKHYQPSSYQLVNAYGPTEATVYASSIKLDKSYLNIPIGKPIKNYKIFILNKDLNLCPIGIAGELCIAGEGLAKGYLNRPDLTEMSFIYHDGLEERIYRTGDLAKWKIDGNIEFLGRTDFQVKVRGYRIELGEIETRLANIIDIKDAVVLALDDKNSNKYLCGYYISDKDLDSRLIQEKLKKYLPDYMVPDVYIKIDKFPLTPNGKVDRKNLPKPDLSSLQSEYVAPRNKIEEIIVHAVEDILKLENIGVLDNFFKLGGSSISAISLVSMISKQGYEISIADILSSPILEDIASNIQEIGLEQKILPAPERELYPVTSSQKGMFLTNILGNQGTTYNIPLCLNINGDIDKERVGLAIDKLIERHESLRTSFEYVDGEVLQKIHNKVNISKHYKKISAEELDMTLKEFVKPFDLSKVPLFRVCLLEIDRTRYVLLFDFHHIIFDGTSVEPFVKELCYLYENKSLNSLEIQYKDYAYWYNHHYIKSDFYKEIRNYWVKHIEGANEIEFPFDYLKSANKSNEAGYVNQVIYPELKQSILSFCQKLDITPYMLMIGVYTLLLSRYSRQNDITIGTATAGRSHSSISEHIGMFVHTLPFRINIEDNQTISKYFSNIKSTTLSLLKNQSYNFEQLIQDAGIENSSGSLPFINFFFNYLEKNLNYNNQDFTIDVSLPNVKESMFDLTLTLQTINNESLEATIQYKKGLFEPNSVKRFLNNYINLLDSVVSCELDKQLKQLDLLKKEEKTLILDKFNDTYYDYPRDKTIIDIFEATIDKYPSSKAIIVDGEEITYSELNRLVNKIANSLPKRKQNSSNIIAIYMTRRIEILASMLAVWKAGYAYVCIDEKYPLERVQYMLDDSQAAMLISERRLIDNISFTGNFNDIDQIHSFSCEYSPQIDINSKDIALLIYTSGSTGNPKGVMLSHQNLMNFSFWYKDKRKLKAGDQIAEYASFSFDACIMGTYPVLITGGTVHILPEYVRMSLEELDKYFYKNKIKGCFLTTQLGEQYLKTYNNEQLDFIEVGGEKLKEWTERSYKFVNGYGPTESTVYVTDFQVDKNYGNIPVGKPLSNVQIYIVDNELKLCPIGVPGELCIAGESLALGYFNQREQTREKFIHNPFKCDGDQRITKDTLYKTGDLAVWRDDGNIEVQGRIDFQVKVRGYRIELGEIETRLANIIDIKDAVVLALDDTNNNKYLCGYYVSDNDLDHAFIQDELKNHLPDYMVPDIYIKMEAFPLTPNGKVDRKNLPKPDLSSLQSEYVAPRNDVEEKISAIWSNILGVNEIGIDDSFFSIGGNSIKAIAVISKLQTEGLKLSIADIFDYKTIRNITENININKFDINLKFDQIISAYEQASIDNNQQLLDLEALANKRISSLYNELESIDISNIENIDTVLVTGATGFLGSHIVSELIKLNKKVIAIVRGKDDSEALMRTKEKLHYYFDTTLDRNFENGDIKIFAGDLSKGKLGLTDDKYSSVLDNVQSIIHTAANVSHYGEYEKFYNDNVLPVKNLINLSKANKQISFHYVSTRSVCELGTYDEKRVIFNEVDVPKVEGIDNVYIKTKLEGEYEAIKARKEGISTNVYRVGNLVYNSETLKHQQNFKDNGFFQTVTSILNIGEVFDGYSAEMSCINDTARAICSIFDKKDLYNGIYHTYNNKLTKLDDILKDNNLGLSLEKTSFVNFVNSIRDKYNMAAFSNYIQDFMLHYGWLGESEHTAFIVQQNYTSKVLEKLNFKWTEINSTNITNMVRDAYNSRVLDFKGFEIFQNCSQETVISLAKKAKLYGFSTGCNIIETGNEADHVYLLQTGFASLNVTSPGGWQSNVGIIADNDHIGIDSICSSKYFLTVEAIVDDCCVYKISKHDLLNINKDELCKVLYNLFKIETENANSMTNLLTLMG
ncbi:MULTISPECIES: non-ribosomal peptide synthetase [unclassified Francisella]|uniref:non-ribosomal peptide synthetase n=1 Tax=unclassified Francisella TaxID=2610885 RepID=UPI002E367418|nr:MULTISPECIES: non-ribosomal peptide synthetase [unclassified Francisella]MED7818402.1 amino acid adenylation domain-containing protein [Francisella sp. 19S2-4]MED7829238.1 amino acid adenylation domain-containing protein [Francisella sp. 19S2-10]